MAHARGSRSATPPSIRALSVADVRHARHRNAGGVVGKHDSRGTPADFFPPDRDAHDTGCVRADDRTYGPAVRDALLEILLASGSDLTLLPVQDVFGWRDRINEPATRQRPQLDLQAAVAR